jgi:hypothetical protein
LQEAAERDDLPADVDETVTLDKLVGVVMFRVRITGRPSTDLASQLTSLILDGQLPTV